MVFVGDERPGGGQEHLHELGHLADDAEGAQGRLLAQVRVGRLEQPLHLGRQVARHLRRRDGAQRAQRQPHHELHRTVQIAAAHTKFKKKRNKNKRKQVSLSVPNRNETQEYTDRLSIARQREVIKTRKTNTSRARLKKNNRETKNNSIEIGKVYGET